MARTVDHIKMTVPRWRVRACLAVLWLVSWVPSLERRDRIAERLAPVFARWIAAGLRRA